MPNPVPTLSLVGTGPFVGTVEFVASVPAVSGTAPTATVIAPAEGSEHAQGSSFLVQIAATAPGSTVDLVEVLIDGSLSATANPTAYNAGTGYYEGTLILAADTTLGNREIQGRVTAANGQVTTSAVRNITVVTAGGGGTTAFTDFSGDTAGALPAWLTQRWVTANSSGSVVADAAALGGKVFRVVQTAGQRTAWSFSSLGGVAIGTPADIEILVKVRSSAITGTTSIAGTVVRGAGAAGTETGYMAAYRNTSESFRIHGFNNGANLSANVAEASPPIIPADTWHFIRHRISGNVHRAKLWAASGAEPSAWTLGDDGTATEGTIAAGGWPALFTFLAATHDFDYVAVGLDGASAPMPA